MHASFAELHSFGLEQMPSMKSNLTDVLKGVPELKDMIAEKLANAPQKEDIKDQVKPCCIIME